MNTVFSISLDKVKLEKTDKLELQDKLLDTGGSWMMSCRSTIVNILTRALGQRVHLLQLCQTISPTVSHI